MTGHLHAFALTSLALGGACANTAKPPVPRYTELPTRPRTAVFAAEPALVPVEVACRSAESPVDNGLDDNCDGRIDGTQPNVSRSLAIAHVVTAPVELRALDADGRVHGENARSDANALRVQRLLFDELGSGPAQIEVRAVAPEATTETTLQPISVSVAVESASGTRTYLTRLEPGRSLLLGRLVPP